MNSNDPMLENGGFKYWAFISYSHKDRKWGDWLHKAIETYRVPGKLEAAEHRGGEIPKRLFPVFRDREELPTSADLGRQINEALRQSRYLIVICSPHSAKSIWVNEEIKTFKAMGREHLVLPLIIGGEPNATDKPESGLEECFPEALRYRVDVQRQILSERTEPIAADARDCVDGKRKAMVKLAAGLLGVGFDTLWDREQERRIRRMTMVGCALAVLVMVVAGLAWKAWEAEAQAVVEQRRAEQSEKQARKALASVYSNLGHAARKQQDWGTALIHYQQSLEQSRTSEATLGAQDALTRFVPEIAVYRTNAMWRYYTSLAFHPDGRRLAWGGASNRMCLWDIQTGVKTDIELGHENSVVAVAYSPDGAKLATGAWDNTVRISDAESGIELFLLNGHQGYVNSISFSPDGKRLASGSHDKTVRIWDVATGKCLTTLRGHKDTVDSVSFSPDGVHLTSGSWDKSIRIWDPATGRALSVLNGHTDRVKAVAYSPKGELLASGSWDNSVRVWNAKEGRAVSVFEGHGRPVLSVAFSPDGTHLASGAMDHTARLWDIAANASTAVLQGHGSSVSSVAFSPDGQTLATASEDDSVHLWDLKTAWNLPVFRGHNDFVYSVAFSPDGKSLASGSGDQTVRVWDAETGAELRILRGHTNTTFSLAFNPQGDRLASGAFDHTVRLFNPQTGETVHVLRGHTGRINAVVFSEDGERLASGSGDGSVRLWDAKAGGQLAKIWEGKAVSSVAFNPQSNTKLAIGEYGQQYVEFEDAAQNETQIKMRAWSAGGNWHAESINSLCFSPDGTKVASGSDDKTIRLWEPETQNVLTVLQGHTEPVSFVTFSPNGRLLASCSMDKTVRIWNVSTGKELIALQGHGDWTTSAAFSPEGDFLATSSADGTVRLWPIAWDDFDSILNKISSCVQFGMSYGLDENNQLTLKKPLSLVEARLEAARQGRLRWRKDGGQSLTPLHKSELNHERQEAE